MEKRISIIVPVYNGETYLDECLKSILTQTYRNLEAIVINDGSQDSSEAICKAWAEKDPRIRYVYQDNAGVSAARNRGLDMASGEYIAFVDADDYLDPAFCRRMAEALGDRADIAFCEEIDHHSNGREVASGTGSMATEMIPSGEYEYWEEKSRDVIWGSLYRRSLLQGMRFSESLFVGEDTLFVAQAIRRAENLVYYHARLYHYRIYEGSAFHGRFDRKKKTQMDAWLQVSNVFPEGSKAKLSAEALSAEVCLNMIRSYINDPGFDSDVQKELIGIYRAKLPKLIRFDRAKHRSMWKHILIGVMPNVFIGRQRKEQK